MRNTRHWSKTQPYISTDSYTNNRRNGWQYDAEGNLIDNLARQYTYDAAGRISTVSGSNLNQFFDGDGQRVKTTEPNLTTYYLRSSVLGGQVIEELDSSGSKQRGFVYVGGKVIAEQAQNGSVGFVHEDLSGTSVRKTRGQLGTAYEPSELDPFRQDTELEDPYLADPNYNGRGEGGPLSPGYGNITQPSSGCTLDGVYALCEWVERGIANGSVTVQKTDSRGNVSRADNPLFLGRSVWVDKWTTTYSTANTNFQIDAGTLTVSQQGAPVVNIYGGNAGEFVSIGGLAPTSIQAPQNSAPTQAQTNARNLLGECGVHALLDTLSYSEHAGYDTVLMGTVIKAPGHPELVGKTNVSVPDFSQHPNILVQVRPGLKSTAAGRYQFLNRTWAGLGLPNFNEFNQDVGAVMLMQRRGMITPLLNGDVEQAIMSGNTEWASLPGSPYGPGTRSMDSLMSVYNRSFFGCVNAVHQIHQGLGNDNGV